MGTGTVVVGGGTAGAAIAGRLAEAGEEVILLEAGPDYGAVDSGRWPQELLDPSIMPVDTHSWNFLNHGSYGAANMPLQRARVIGGCSSHNGCAVVWGHRSDYDRWEQLGNPGWGAAGLLPFLQSANERFEVFTPERDDITPFHQSVLDSAGAVGYPVDIDYCDLDASHGFGIGPVNIHRSLRWNAGFAYLDPVRERPNFTIVDNVLVDRLEVEGDRITGLTAIDAGKQISVQAERVILACGAYGTPLVLQRSGIGDTTMLEPAGVDQLVELAGVGRNLQDHPAIGVRFSGTPKLTAFLDDFVARGGMPREEGTIGLASSRRCDGPFDLHIYPIAHRNKPGDWDVFIGAAVMTPKSSGHVAIMSPDPTAQPLIEHGFLTDETAYDRDALVDAVLLIREMVQQQPLAGLIGTEIEPTISARTEQQLKALVPAISVHDYHPTSTCKMGPVSDWLAVVDSTGAVYGLSNLIIGDASIMPGVPMANTNLPALAVAEKIVAGLLER